MSSKSKGAFARERQKRVVDMSRYYDNVKTYTNTRKITEYFTWLALTHTLQKLTEGESYSLSFFT